MPPHTPHDHVGLTWTDRMAALGGQSALIASYVPPSSPARARTRRVRGIRIAATVAPLTRCAVVVLSAGLLLGAEPAASAGERFAVSGGHILAPAVQRAHDARAAALSAQALARAEVSGAEAVAVAAAALKAAAAVEPLTATLPPEQGAAELGPAVVRLTALVSAATSTGRPAAMSAPAPTADERLRLAGEVADSAAEVFRLSMQVETLTQEAAAAESPDRTLGLQVLEDSVASAAQAVAELGELEPLVPLPPTVEGEADAQDDAPVPRTPATTSRALLCAEAAEGVVRFVERWSNGDIPEAELCPVLFAPGTLLQCDAAEALVRLNAAYRDAHGRDLQIVSSYRTLEKQVALKAQKGGLAATPGTSNHGWGLAIDIAGIGGLGEFDAPGYLWLKEHAGAFGWHHPHYMEPGGRGPQEPWHWEFGTA